MNDNSVSKSTPLIFTPDMMKGIISGAKTQTCRNLGRSVKNIQKLGDLIWVRENFYEKGLWRSLKGSDDVSRDELYWMSSKEVVYASDQGKPTSQTSEYSWRSRPSIHMPRWASRYTLSVTELSHKPVQCLTLDEINREGIGIFVSHAEAIKAWCALWVALYGHDSWQSNPEVVVIGFSHKKGGSDE